MTIYRNWLQYWTPYHALYYFVKKTYAWEHLYHSNTVETIRRQSCLANNSEYVGMMYGEKHIKCVLQDCISQGLIHIQLVFLSLHKYDIYTNNTKDYSPNLHMCILCRICGRKPFITRQFRKMKNNFPGTSYCTSSGQEKSVTILYIPMNRHVNGL